MIENYIKRIKDSVYFHSYLYYMMDKNMISDLAYDRMLYHAMRLFVEYPVESENFHEGFSTSGGSTLAFNCPEHIKTKVVSISEKYGNSSHPPFYTTRNCESISKVPKERLKSYKKSFDFYLENVESWKGKDELGTITKEYGAGENWGSFEHHSDGVILWDTSIPIVVRESNFDELYHKIEEILKWKQN